MTLVLADWLITSAVADPKKDSGVRVIGSTITDVGTRSELLDRYGEDEVVDGGEAVLMPGFVNAHVHLYGTLAHGIPTASAPSGFWSFLEDYWWPKVENRLDHTMIEAATDWVCAEMLRSGTTTFFDILEAPSALPDALMVEKAATERAGMRGVLSFEACERIDATNGLLGLSENAKLVEECRSSELVSGAMSIHTTFTCSPEFIRTAFEMAQDLDVLFHAHVNEGVHEGAWCEEHHQMRTMEHYEALGVAGSRFLASQCVQMSDRELEIIAETGVRVSHMPLSNCEVGGGIAPMTELLESGVTVGLGSDGYLNDMFEVMRGAFLLHKARLLDPGAMPAREVFHMATAGSALALDLANVGCLDIGFAADLQMVDAQFPTPVSDHNLFEQLVLWRNGSNVTDVMVAGEWRVRSRELLGADLDQMRAATGVQARRLWAGA